MFCMLHNKLKKVFPHNFYRNFSCNIHSIVYQKQLLIYCVLIDKVVIFFLILTLEHNNKKDW